MSQIIELTVTNGTPTTTSLAIAQRFGKRPSDVLRAIELMECSEGYRERNFAPTSRAVPGPNGATRLEPMYNVTKDGFMFLAMGFTGKEAAAWKERFIEAFNAMERQLREQAAAKQINQHGRYMHLPYGSRQGELPLLDCYPHLTRHAMRRINQLAFSIGGAERFNEWRSILLRRADEALRDRRTNRDDLIEDLLQSLIEEDDKEYFESF